MVWQPEILGRDEMRGELRARILGIHPALTKRVSGINVRKFILRGRGGGSSAVILTSDGTRAKTSISLRSRTTT